jgi:hypothetical protein
LIGFILDEFQNVVKRTKGHLGPMLVVGDPQYFMKVHHVQAFVQIATTGLHQGRFSNAHHPGDPHEARSFQGLQDFVLIQFPTDADLGWRRKEYRRDMSFRAGGGEGSLIKDFDIVIPAGRKQTEFLNFGESSVGGYPRADQYFMTCQIERVL